jgi:hypothetical protein
MKLSHVLLTLGLVLMLSVPATAAFKFFEMGAQMQADGTNGYIYIEGMTMDTVAKTLVITQATATVDPSSPGTWKDAQVAAVIAAAATQGMTMTAADIWLMAYEQGDYKPTNMVAMWDKDKTMLNIPAAYTNIYPALGGEQQIVDFGGYKQYRFAYAVQKIGNTTTRTAALVDAGNASNVIAADDATATLAEHAVDTGWINLPAWAVGEKALKPMAKDPAATGDDIYHAFVLYLR